MSLKDKKERWEEETLQPNLERFPARKPEFKTSSETPLDPLYTPSLSEEEYEEKVGFPGEYPFTRGIRVRLRRRVQPALPLPAGSRANRALGRLRPPHPDRLRRR